MLATATPTSTLLTCTRDLILSTIRWPSDDQSVLQNCCSVETHSRSTSSSAFKAPGRSFLLPSTSKGMPANSDFSSTGELSVRTRRIRHQERPATHMTAILFSQFPTARYPQSLQGNCRKRIRSDTYIVLLWKKYTHRIAFAPRAYRCHMLRKRACLCSKFSRRSKIHSNTTHPPISHNLKVTAPFLTFFMLKLCERTTMFSAVVALA